MARGRRLLLPPFPALDVTPAGVGPAGNPSAGGTITAPTAVPEEIAFLYAWSGSLWVPVRTQGDTAAGRQSLAVTPILYADQTTDLDGAMRTSRTDGGTLTTGVQAVALHSTDAAGAWYPVRTANDALGNASGLSTFGHRHNGTGWDRERGNTEATLLASAVRAATTSSADQTNYNGRGLHVLFNITVAGTSTLTLKIEGKDPVSGTYYALLTGLGETTTGLKVYKVYPGIGVSANASASDILPRTWRVTVTHGDASNWTYSVGAVVVV